MSFLDRFTQKKDNDIQYHATAKVLINLACDVDESIRLSKDLLLTEDELAEFHRHKRDLACKTVFYTALSTMKLNKRNKFLEIFIAKEKEQDDLDNAPPDVREIMFKMNEITDEAYHEVFSQITNDLKNTPEPYGIPVDKLMESFCWLFCSFLGKEKDRTYFEIGQHIFNRHHERALRMLENL